MLQIVVEAAISAAFEDGACDVAAVVMMADGLRMQQQLLHRDLNKTDTARARARAREREREKQTDTQTHGASERARETEMERERVRQAQPQPRSSVLQTSGSCGGGGGDDAAAARRWLAGGYGLCGGPSQRR